MGSPSNPFVFSLLIFLCLSATTLSSSMTKGRHHQVVITEVKGCPFTALYNFGGSSSSSHENGKLLHIPDYMASRLHLPSVNSYSKKGANFEHGVNFAVPGSTTLNSSFSDKNKVTFPTSANNSLQTQINLFESHLTSICSPNRVDCLKRVKKSIFLVGDIGSNDYNYAFFQGKPMKEVMAYVPKVVHATKVALKTLIDEGAIHLVVPGLMPVGCLPSYLTVFGNEDHMNYDEHKCLRSFNYFASFHNAHLTKALSELRHEYPHVQIVYADYYKAFTALVRNHVILGFQKSTLRKACCGAGGGQYNFQATRMCGSEGVSVCSHPFKYIHWDGIRLTQEAYEYMVEGFLSGSFAWPKFKLPERWHCSM